MEEGQGGLDRSARYMLLTALFTVYRASLRQYENSTVFFSNILINTQLSTEIRQMYVNIKFVNY